MSWNHCRGIRRRLIPLTVTEGMRRRCAVQLGHRITEEAQQLLIGQFCYLPPSFVCVISPFFLGGGDLPLLFCVLSPLLGGGGYLPLFCYLLSLALQSGSFLLPSWRPLSLFVWKL